MSSQLVPGLTGNIQDQEFDLLFIADRVLEDHELLAKMLYLFMFNYNAGRRLRFQLPWLTLPCKVQVPTGPSLSGMTQPTEWRMDGHWAPSILQHLLSIPPTSLQKTSPSRSVKQLELIAIIFCLACGSFVNNCLSSH